jgi:predicted choloylglycine hydrolase
MYTDNVPRRIIRLSEPASTRWGGAHLEEDKKDAALLIKEAEKDVADYMGDYSWMLKAYPVVSGVVRRLYSMYGGLYLDDMEFWAKSLGMSLGRLVMLNCAYEISHVTGKLYGCTAGAIRQGNRGWCHVRNMDWPLKAIGRATRIYEYQTPTHMFYSVGMPGYVGVISGMVPGAYSVTINWAPPVGRPTFDFGPGFLLRHVLETCTKVHDAIEVLSSTPLATSVFYTVVSGLTPLVIERTPTRSAVRYLYDQGAQGNHFHDKTFGNTYNTDKEHVEWSVSREDRLSRSISTLTKKDKTLSLTELAGCLDDYPTCNECSYQQMIFVPHTGELEVWRWL